VSGARPILKFFLDESVPDSVGKMCETHSHEVIYLNREIARGSSDYLRPCTHKTRWRAYRS
jgi:hypothetical protein